jgi:hypothetical protein
MKQHITFLILTSLALALFTPQAQATSPPPPGTPQNHRGPNLGVGPSLQLSTESLQPAYWVEAGYNLVWWPAYMSVNAGLSHAPNAPADTVQWMGHADFTLGFLSAGPIVAGKGSEQHFGGMIALNVPVSGEGWQVFRGTASEMRTDVFLQPRFNGLFGGPNTLMLTLVVKARLLHFDITPK